MPSPGLQITPDYFVTECRELWKSAPVLQDGACWQVISWVENCQRAGFGVADFNYTSVSPS